MMHIKWGWKKREKMLEKKRKEEEPQGGGGFFFRVDFAEFCAATARPRRADTLRSSWRWTETFGIVCPGFTQPNSVKRRRCYRALAYETNSRSFIKFFFKSHIFTSSTTVVIVILVKKKRASPRCHQIATVYQPPKVFLAQKGPHFISNNNNNNSKSTVDSNSFVCFVYLDVYQFDW